MEKRKKENRSYIKWYNNNNKNNGNSSVDDCKDDDSRLILLGICVWLTVKVLWITRK